MVEGGQAGLIVFAILQQCGTAQDRLSAQVGCWESLLPLNRSVKHFLSKFSGVKPPLAQVLGVLCVCVTICVLCGVFKC